MAVAAASYIPETKDRQSGLPTLPKAFTFSADYYLAQIWHAARSENVNPPLNDLPTGARPGLAEVNVLQMQGTARGYGNIEFVDLTNALPEDRFRAGPV